MVAKTKSKRVLLFVSVFEIKDKKKDIIEIAFKIISIISTIYSPKKLIFHFK